MDLVTQEITGWIQKYGVQLIVLGTGEKWLEERFRELASWYPQNIAFRAAFSSALSHRVEAGIDLFLMPSRYEPCGLNQLYSHRYGTLPLVRLTGGLADTVVNGSDENIATNTANGFCFNAGNGEDLNKCLDWAMHCFFNRKEDWKKMVLCAMSQDWSWHRSARQYLELYQQLLSQKEEKK